MQDQLCRDISTVTDLLTAFSLAGWGCTACLDEWEAGRAVLQCAGPLQGAEFAVHTVVVCQAAKTVCMGFECLAKLCQRLRCQRWAVGSSCSIKLGLFRELGLLAHVVKGLLRASRALLPLSDMLLPVPGVLPTAVPLICTC